MALLLAALVLVCSAALAALLAWLDTRGKFALLCAGSLGITALALVVVGLGLRDEEAAAEEVELAQVDEAAPAEEVIPREAALPVAAGGEAFVIEAATAEAVFDRPTSFTLDDEGNLYVGFERGIARARDVDGDGFYESVQQFGHDGGWVFGLDFHDGYLYAAIDGTVQRFEDVDGDGVADQVDVLIDGLVTSHYGGHSNSGLAVGPDELIYMTVGGSSDHGPELNPVGGTILRMGLQGGEYEVYARGFRNPYDLTFCPDGRLYASDNGPDQSDDPTLADAPDEVNLVLPGRRYGYPDYFGPTDASTGTEPPIALLPERSGSTGIVCHSGNGMPQAFAGNLFVTLWGTFTAPVETGRRVMRVVLEETPDGGVEGMTTEFASGFGNPIDIIEDADGSLLVLDFSIGQVFRIRYGGDLATGG